MNNKSVLISIRPQWCEKICHQIGTENGKPIYEKTIEVRKTRPKFETPFKCYIYCTKGSKHLCLMQNEGGVNLIVCGDWTTAIPVGGNVSNGKVIGEFVCDEMYKITITGVWKQTVVTGKWERQAREVFDNICLSPTDLTEYLGSQTGYGWHVSNLQIYEKPRELSEFGLDRAPQSWGYVEVSK